MDFRTDLALERREAMGEAALQGVESERQDIDNAHITRIRVTDREGEAAIGKPVGTYVTVEVPPFTDDAELFDGRLTAVAEELRRLLPEEGLILVAGLGNEEITPDALGPRAAAQVLATRHIGGELARSIGLEGLRPVAGITPGVLGQTGIETGEIIRGIVAAVKPAAVVTVDALASRRLARLGCTVQLADTGVTPGSGVGNARQEINETTIGVPIVAVGVPTVVDAATLAADLFAQTDAEVDAEEVRRAVEPRGAHMIVTPREIDLLIERAARLIAMGINTALQPTLSAEDLLSLVG